MTLSTSLDVALGLAFVYLLLSLVATAVMEGIASLFLMRARNLRQALRNLLGTAVAQEVYDHPLLKGLARPGKPPSYIPSRTFALALLDVLSKPAAAGSSSAASDSLDQVLALLKAEANGDVEAYKQKIETWFNDTMDRASGWYKRRTQAITLTIGVVVAVATNADSVTMYRRLVAQPTLRAALVAEATEYAREAHQAPPPSEGGADKTGASAKPSPAPTQLLGDLQRRIREQDALVGWVVGARADGSRDPNVWPGWPLPSRWPGILAVWAWVFQEHWFGWILTGFAISIGAPFWFDVLNKIIMIRSAGRAPEEQQKSPKATT